MIPFFQELLGYGDFSDYFAEESSTLSLRWEEGRIESITRSDDSGAGLRYLNGAETRFAHADLNQPVSGKGSVENESKLIRLKNSLISGLSPKPCGASRGVISKTHNIRQSPTTVALEKKIALLERAYKAANTGPHIRQINVNYGEKIKNIFYLNSLGESYREERVYSVFSLTVVTARARDTQTAYESLGGLVGFELFEGDRVERLAAEVCKRAHLKLDAPQAPVGEMPVVIASSAGGTLIHEAIGHSLEADAVLEGTSPSYVGKIGTRVAHPKLTVYDDPTVPGARGSFHFDDEGTPSEPTRLIENGVLKTYLYDRLSAGKAGRNSNGHGRRESYAHRPIPRMSNTFVAPGPDDPADILRDFKNGLLVTKMGGGQVNTANGDFVFEVEEGFQVKNGIRTMVRGATLLGNGPKTLLEIDKVGSDHGWAIGTCGKEGQGVPVSDALPTVHIKKMVVGGQ
ncbi:MAG: Metalloprotease TldD [Elusimicrobia bacterium]|nr:Metalloprotease TldD [Elusimicrobiota bacterium]